MYRSDEGEMQTGIATAIIPRSVSITFASTLRSGMLLREEKRRIDLQRCTTCGAAFDDSMAMCPRDGTPLFAAESSAPAEQPAAAGQGVATLEELSDAISLWEHEEPELDDPTQLMQIDDREAFERHAREAAAAAAAAEEPEMIPDSALEPIPASRPGGGQREPQTQPMVDVSTPQRREPTAVPASSGPPRPPRHAPQGSSPQNSPPARQEPSRDAQQPHGRPSHGPPQRAEQGSSPPKTLHGFPGVQGPPAATEPGSHSLAESSSAAFDPPGVEPQVWHPPEQEPVGSYAPVGGSSERRHEPTSDMELQPEDEVAEKKSGGIFAVVLIVGLLLIVALGGAYFYFQPLLEEGSADDALEPIAAVPVEEPPTGDELAVAEAEAEGDAGLEFEVDELEQGLELASVEAAALAERAVSAAELVVLDMEKAKAQEAPPKRKKRRAKRRRRPKPKPKPSPKPAAEDTASDDISIWGGSDDDKEEAPAKKKPAEKKPAKKKPAEKEESSDDSLDIW